MRLGTFALAGVGIGLALAWIIGAVLAGQINCGYVPSADCYALKMQSWQLAVIPGLAGLGLLIALPAANNVSSPETSNTPDGP